MAALGPQNIWPRFRFQLPIAPVRIANELSEEDRRGTFTDARASPLPYLIQDNYNRQRQSGQLPTVQIENAALRATFYPTLGGRLSVARISAKRQYGYGTTFFNSDSISLV